MPKTKFQSVIFSLLMVFSMVFCMTCYTIARNQGGLSCAVFASAIREMWVEFAVVFVLIFFVITHLAQKIAFRLLIPEKCPPIAVILSIQTLTVAMIVPAITLFATFFHHGFTGAWLVQWLELWGVCLPAAFFLQILYVGPAVRFVFRLLFRKALEH